MKTFLHLFLVGFSLSLVSACGFTKDLQTSQEALLAATGNDISISEKRDVLATSMVGMMHDAVDRLNPKQGVKYVKAFAKTNGPIVDTLSAQIIRGQAKMSDAQRMSFMLPVLTKPYAKDALTLLPRFIKRYKQYEAVINMTSQLKSAVLGKLGNSLGGFGERDFLLERPVGLNWECEEEGRAR